MMLFFLRIVHNGHDIQRNILICFELFVNVEFGEMFLVKQQDNFTLTINGVDSV